MRFLNNWQHLMIKLISWYISILQCKINFWLLFLTPKWNAPCKKLATKSFHQKLWETVIFWTCKYCLQNYMNKACYILLPQLHFSFTLFIVFLNHSIRAIEVPAVRATSGMAVLERHKKTCPEVNHKTILFRLIEPQLEPQWIRIVQHFTNSLCKTVIIVHLRLWGVYQKFSGIRL